MADKTQIDNSARGSSSRESTPEDHRVGLMAEQPLSMDSLILSGESSDDILMDELEDEEEIGSGEDDDDDDEAMAAADTEAGSMEGVNGAADQSESSGVGRTGSGQPNSKKKQSTSAEQQQQTRNKKKRRVSTRQRKISISSRLKVNS